jgi:hypothetical protein
MLGTPKYSTTYRMAVSWLAKRETEIETETGRRGGGRRGKRRGRGGDQTQN